MSNRRRDTKPELALRRAVHALGLRYRVDVRPDNAIRRHADMVFSRAKVAVFLDGCYWHGCPEHYRQPAQNSDYWSDKVTRNRDRDAQTNLLLTEAGWTVIRVWEHEDLTHAAQRIESIVKSKSAKRR